MINREGAATDLDAVVEKLDGALEGIPEVEASIKTKQKKEAVGKGKGKLRVVRENVRAAKALLTGDQPDEPDEPDEPGGGGGGNTSGAWPNRLPPAPVPGQVITGKRFTGGTGGYGNPWLAFAGKRNMVVTENIFEKTERSLLRTEPGTDTIIYHNQFRDIQWNAGVHGSIFIFPGENYQTSYIRYGLALVENDFLRVKMKAIIELKCSKNFILRNKFTDCAGRGRVRHGEDTFILFNEGMPDFGFRCGPHYFVGNKQSVGWAFCGNLPGEKGKWEHLHKHGGDSGGFNMQAAFRLHAADNAGLIVGKANSSATSEPARDCVVDPDHPNANIVEKLSTGTKREKIVAPSLTREIQFFEEQHRDRMEEMREIATVTRDAKVRDILNRENEVGLWHLECRKAVFGDLA